MARPLPELIEEYDDDPTKWEVVKTKLEPSTHRRNPGGTSVQELLRRKETGEEMIRHTVLRPSGKTFRKPHFRSDWN